MDKILSKDPLGHIKLSVSNFNKSKDFSNVEKYALDTIKTEATQEEISWFSQDYHIPLSKVKHVLSINLY